MSRATEAVHRATDLIFGLLYPGEDASRENAQMRREVRALTAAFWAFIAGAVTGLFVFQGPVSAWGLVSAGSIGLVAASICAGLASAGEYSRSTRSTRPTYTRGRRLQRYFDTVVIGLAHAGIAALVMMLLTAVVVQGFIGMQLDMLTSTLIVGFTAGAATYTGTISGGNITMKSLSTLLALFMGGGIIVAMLTTSEAEWWQLHFSELGTGDDFSSRVFNATFFVGGFLFASLASLIHNELSVWAAAATPSTHRNVTCVTWLFVGIGFCIAGVGLVPVNVSLLMHNTFATGMAVLFGALLIGLRWWLDGFAKPFLLFSDGVMIAIIVAALFFWPIGSYNLAAFEVIAAGAIALWLVIFLRHLAASTSLAGASQGVTQLSPEESR